MIKIKLDNRTIIPLINKSILILPSGSNTNNIVNNEDDYDVIIIIAGNDRTINIELHQPAIIIVQDEFRTVVNVTGGMALPISQVVFIGGDNNQVNGLITQNSGRIISSNGSEFDISNIADLGRITISR